METAESNDLAASGNTLAPPLCSARLQLPWKTPDSFKALCLAGLPLFNVHGGSAGTRPLWAIFQRRRARPRATPTCSRAFLMVASTLIARRILLLSQSLDEKDAPQLSSVKLKQASRGDRDAHRPGLARRIRRHAPNTGRTGAFKADLVWVAA